MTAQGLLTRVVNPFNLGFWCHTRRLLSDSPAISGFTNGFSALLQLCVGPWGGLQTHSLLSQAKSPIFQKDISGRLFVVEEPALVFIAIQNNTSLSRGGEKTI
jgi:hypothetical protein